MVLFTLISISFDFNYIPLFVVLAAAWVIPMGMSLLKLSRIPSVMVEIIAGFFIGQYIFNGFDASDLQYLEFLSLTGFIFLMFESGLDTDINKLLATLPKRKIKLEHLIKNPLLFGVIFFGLALILALFLVFLMNLFFDISNVWYFSLILTTTSVGVIVPVLKNRGEINSRYGQMLVTTGAIIDVVSIILFTFTAFIYKHGFEFKLLLIILIFLTFLLFYRAGTKLIKVNLFRKIIYQLSHATSQIKVRGTFFLIFIFTVLAQYLGKEVILLGAFLSGLLLSSYIQKSRSVLLIQLNGISYGFFIPIFFIMVGAQFNPEALKEFDNSFFLFFGATLIILYAVKIIPGMIWSGSFGSRKALSGGILMASQLGLMIAASQIGLEMGIISPGMNASFILLAVITLFLSPISYNLLNRHKAYKGEQVIIVGASSTGVLLARRMNMYGREAIVVENNKERHDDLKSKGINTYLGNGADMKTYRDINLKAEDHVVVLTSQDEKNYNICNLLREQFNHEKIISMSQNTQIENLLSNLDVQTLDKTRIMASTIENFHYPPHYLSCPHRIL